MNFTDRSHLVEDVDPAELQNRFHRRKRQTQAECKMNAFDTNNFSFALRFVTLMYKTIYIIRIYMYQNFLLLYYDK